MKRDFMDGLALKVEQLFLNEARQYKCQGYVSSD